MLQHTVHALHEEQLAEHGGASGIRDEGLLKSALDRPRNRHAYSDPPSDIADLAASYAFGLAKTHPFTDGNKRAAWVVCETFLAINGYAIDATDADALIVMLGLADGRISEGAFAGWLRDHLT